MIQAGFGAASPPQHFFTAEPKAVHGALAEGMHLTGYSFARAMESLKWLLTDDRWRGCGDYPRKADFIATIDLSAFKHTVEQRRELARLLKEDEPVSNRQIAKTLGVNPATIDRDVQNAANAAHAPEAPKETAPPEPQNAANAAPLRRGDPGYAEPQPMPPSGEMVHERATAATKRPRSGNASHDNDDEWYTPPELIEASRAALGEIDLDPASSDTAQEVVRAARYFTAEDDGLEQPWAGRVFLNPPYSKKAGKAEFLAKLADHHRAWDVPAAVAVLSYDFSAGWFEPLRGLYAAVCLMRGRVQFYKEKPGDGHDPALGTSVVYLGTDVPAFASAFKHLGDIVVPWRDQ